jgi:hypothetical protein
MGFNRGGPDVVTYSNAPHPEVIRFRGPEFRG